MKDFSACTISAIDILFITHLELPRDTGDPEVYKPLRLHMGENVATIQFLRNLAQQNNNGVPQKNLYNEHEKLFLPQVLTPIYLSDYLTRKGLTFVEIPCLEIGKEQLKQALKNKVGVIAISTTWLPGLYGAQIVRKAVSFIRSYAQDIPIIIGGVLVRKSIRVRSLLLHGEISGFKTSELSEHYFLIDPAKDRDMDAIVVSESGEKTLAEIALRVKQGLAYKELPNLAIPARSGYSFTKEEPENIDLDTEIVDWRRHKDKIQYFEAPIRAGVGCPFNCSFCDFSGLYKIKSRSMESLFKELKTLQLTLPEPRRVYFTDDNLAITKQRIKEVALYLIKAKLGITWRTLCRVDAIDSEAAALMKEAGCRECFLGIESGDAQILKNMNKKLDLENAQKGIEMLDNEGINTISTFIVGFPGETSATIERTAQFISAIPAGKSAHAVHQYYLFRFELLPLSVISKKEERKRYDLKGIGEQWSHKTMDSEEAREAVLKIFLKVHGPTHAYLEAMPAEWPSAKTNQLLEMREALQKKHIMNNNSIDISPLIKLIRADERVN